MSSAGVCWRTCSPPARSSQSRGFLPGFWRGGPGEPLSLALRLFLDRSTCATFFARISVFSSSVRLSHQRRNLSRPVARMSSTVFVTIVARLELDPTLAPS